MMAMPVRVRGASQGGGPGPTDPASGSVVLDRQP